MTRTTGVALMIAAPVLWSSAGVVTRHIQSATAVEQVFWRSLFAFIFVFVFLFWKSTPWRAVRSAGWPGIVSGLLWAVIFLGAVLAVVGSYFFRVKDPRLHRFLVLLLTTFIAMVIFVVFAFDQPFRGNLGIDAEPYQLVYDQLMKSS